MSLRNDLPNLSNVVSKQLDLSKVIESICGTLSITIDNTFDINFNSSAKMQEDLVWSPKSANLSNYLSVL